MSSAVSFPNHTLLGRLSQAVNQYCAHSFARNRQLPFLNQRKGENDRRKYFMINLHERMLPTSAGVEPATSWSPVGRRIQLSHRGRPFQVLRKKNAYIKEVYSLAVKCLIFSSSVIKKISLFSRVRSTSKKMKVFITRDENCYCIH